MQWLRNYLDRHNLGVVTGPDGMTRLFSDTVRGPDVAFVRWQRLPGGRLPTEPIPAVAPNFVIEVLSGSNTYAEMSRKRREYFHAGVEIVWMVDPRERTITVYRTANDFHVYREGGSAACEPVLPDWSVDTVADAILDTISELRDAEHSNDLHRIWAGMSAALEQRDEALATAEAQLAGILGEIDGATTFNRAALTVITSSLDAFLAADRDVSRLNAHCRQCEEAFEADLGRFQKSMAGLTNEVASDSATASAMLTTAFCSSC